jgi:dCTP deaminase
MSVFPLISSGHDRNVVDSDQAFQDAGGLEGKTLLIKNLDQDQLSSPAASEDSNTSYDLRVGQEYRDHRDIGKSELPKGQELKLLPGAAIVIETEESVQLPRSMFGHIVPKVSLLQKGISNTCSKVDPGYHGHLLVTIFNLGKKEVSFKRGERFCSLYILDVKPGARAYSKDGKRIPGTAKGHRLQKTLDWLEANGAIVQTINAIFSIVAVLISICSVIYLRAH